jgi:hypothetical protein
MSSEEFKKLPVLELDEDNVLSNYSMFNMGYYDKETKSVHIVSYIGYLVIIKIKK